MLEIDLLVSVNSFHPLSHRFRHHLNQYQVQSPPNQRISFSPVDFVVVEHFLQSHPISKSDNII